jgi:hypothetical protein
MLISGANELDVGMVLADVLARMDLSELMEPPTTVDA